MPAIETVTSPLAILLDNGDKKLAAACFEHQLGLLYLDPFWHLKSPADSAHLIKGQLRGDGPWRISQATIRVLGCANTDPELQVAFNNWNEYLQNTPDYPPQAQIREIAKKLGAVINSE